VLLVAPAVSIVVASDEIERIVMKQVSADIEPGLTNPWRRTGGRNLRQHLLWLTLGTLFPVVLIAAIGAVVLALREQETFERGVRERTRAVLTAIDAELRASISVLDALATSRDLDDGNLRAFYDEAVRVAASQPDWLGLRLATPTGQQLIDVSRTFGAELPTIAERSSFDRVVSTGEPAISDLLQGTLSRQIDFAVRVAIRRDGSVRYVLSAIVSPRAIYRILQAQGLPSDWVGVVVDRNRRFVARTVANDERLGQVSSLDLQAQVSEAPQGWQLGKTLEGTSVYTAHDTSPLSGWSFAIGVPAGVVESAARQTILLVLLGTMGAVGMALLLAAVLGRRFAAPISSLAESARALAHGVPAAVPLASGVTEVADLASALEEAGAAVHARVEVQRQLAAVTGNATVALFMTDARQRCTFMNPAAERMTGYTLDEAKDRPLHDLVHRSGEHELHDAADCPLTLALVAHRPLQGDDVFIHRGGSRYDIAYAASPLRAGTRAVGAVIEVRDVSLQKSIENERAALLEREKRARAEAEQANRAKDEFLAMLGHELRNPLAAITNASQVLERSAGEPAGRARAVIARQAAHLARLVDDLLDAGRVATGKIVIAREPVALDEVVRRTLATLAAADKMAEHRVSVELQPVFVRGDETRLEQVVTNLLTNALRYTRAGGSVSISLMAIDRDAVLVVADSGIGIAQHVLPRVFDLFVQGERGIERAHGGLGIGLTLVKRLVELHGGTVVAASDGEDKGSTFTVRLPLLPTPPAVATAIRPHSGAFERRRILVVEDNSDARAMLRDSLEMAGHEVYDRADGAAGLAAALSLKPDAAIIDIGLPGLSGYELARRIRSVADGRMTLIALTGYGQDEDRQRALQSGFDLHIVKPVEAEKLLEAVASKPADTRLQA
jgi:PAS domain S-box-containing protein